MRIGIICQNYPPAISEGGISHYTSHLVDGLICRGHQVIAISSTEFTHASGYEKVQNRFKLALVPGPWRKEAVAIIKRTARYHKLDFLILQYSPASFHYRFRVAALARSNIKLRRCLVSEKGIVLSYPLPISKALPPKSISLEKPAEKAEICLLQR